MPPHPLLLFTILLTITTTTAIPTLAQIDPDTGLNVTFHGANTRACDRRCAPSAEGLDIDCAPGVPGKNGDCWSCCWYVTVQATPSATPVVKNPNGGGYGRREGTI